jgi:hypothetical protein
MSSLEAQLPRSSGCCLAVAGRRPKLWGGAVPGSFRQLVVSFAQMVLPPIQQPRGLGWSMNAGLT